MSVLDLARDLDFPVRDVYRAAQTLVHRGLVERLDIEWGEMKGGRERTHRLIGVRFVPLWGRNGSRKWK